MSKTSTIACPSFLRRLKYTACCAALFIATLGMSASFASTASAPSSVKVLETPPASETNPFYVGNRQPLLPSSFYKLPIGSIKPAGWLEHQLELEADGMTGHLEEISKWCKFEDSAWASPDGQGKYGWEELPYWLKGYGDLGYVLNDPKIIKEARKWIDATLSSQEPDGFFGPRANKTSLEGHPDLWPHMVMLNVLQSFYEATSDPRVIPFMTRYLKWLNNQPPETFGRGYWPKIRFGDTIESAYWLYNRTGEPFLLELGKKIHDNMARWDTGVINWHNVNIAQGFREPGVYYVQAKDRRFLDAAERNYQTVMGIYGQFPGGGFAGDENCRPGYVGPRQGFETCGIVEFMHSFEMLTKISGNPIWSDRCEELAFNSLPAAMTPDLKGLHYLTCANQVQLDTKNKAPEVENGGNMFAYSPYELYRCCQHNVSHGWPYFAEELWLATADRGLCASLYAPSQVSAKVGDGTTVAIAEQTDYPFRDTIRLRITTPKPVEFPLYFRVPAWCKDAAASVNGKAVKLAAKPLSYAAVQRTWRDGDVVTIKLPMTVSVRTWAKNQNSVSVDYGPLTFSLNIGQRWSRYGDRKWAEYEVFPTTPWNYGLVFDSRNPSKSFKVINKLKNVPDQPFTPETAPIEIKAKARKIPQWRQDWFGLVGKLQPSPVKSDAPEETITLVPMGAARLRLTAFPVIGKGNDAHTWAEAKRLPVSASHCFASDTVEALVDGKEPKSSSDRSIPRFTWWDHKGTSEWVQYDFGKPRTVSSMQVYFFDDTAVGGNCRVPQTWRVLYQDGERWIPVEATADYTRKTDAYNRVSFRPARTTGLRLEAQLQPQYSAGILELKVGQ